MSSYLRDEVNPTSFATAPRRSKAQGGFVENVKKSFDAAKMQSGSAAELYVEDTWEPIVNEIESITGKSFKNPGSYLNPNVFAILSGEATNNYGKRRYDYEARQVESYVRENRDALPPELVVSVLDPDRDDVWVQAARDKYFTEQSELAELTARSPGLGDATGRFVGGMAFAATDPINQSSMAIPAGWATKGKGLLGLVFFEAAVNATTEAIQQPGVAAWYKSLGLEYGWEEFRNNVGTAALIGGAFPVGIKIGGETIKLTAEQLRRGAQVLSAASGGKSKTQVTAEALEDVYTSAAESTPLVKTQAADIEHNARLTEAEIAFNSGKLPKVSEIPSSPVELPENVNMATNIGGIVDEFDPNDIGVDAKTFQFKEGGDEFGVTDRLQGVTEWNPYLGGMVTIYEYADGRLFIADGHQRLGLAKRISQQDPSQKVKMIGYRLREVDGITPEDAMVTAALKNISEGSGTAIDAAKVLRSRPDRIRELPPKSAFVRQATDLANLIGDAWGMVKNEVVAPNFAAIVGRLIPNDEVLQKAALDVLAKTEPANAFQAESIVRQVRETSLVSETQESLFGDEVLTTSLFMERAKVLDRAQKQLRKDKSSFQNLIKNATRLEDEGNLLARDANQRRAQEDGKAVALLQSQANRKGALSDALTAAARNAKETGSYNAATTSFIEDVRRAISAGEFDRAEVGDVGRSFDAPDEIASIRTSAEEGQLDAFDDAFGQGSLDQASQLEGDVLGSVIANDAAKAKIGKPAVMPEDRIVRVQDMDKIEAEILDEQLKVSQNFADVDEIMARAERNHAELTDEISKAAKFAGATQKKAELKKRDRVEQKIQDKYSGDLNLIADVARGGISAETNEAAEEFINALSKRYKLIDEGYAFTSDGYFDRKLSVIFDDGQIGEVQIWPPGMLEAKVGGGTKLYNVSRDLNQPDAARAQAVEDMKKLYGEVAGNLSESWSALINRQLPSGIDQPLLTVRDSTISRVTSGERMSESISAEEIGFQDPSVASKTIAPGSVSIAGMDPSTRKNLNVDTSDTDILLEELQVNFSEDTQIPIGSRLDEETNEIVPQFQTLRDMKDEFDQDVKMLDRLRGCAK
jgi:hypothetical protein